MSELQAVAKRIWSGAASEQELAALSVDDVRAIKSDDENPRHLFVAQKAFGIDVDKRRVLGVPISGQEQDRMGDIIDLKGWQLDNYKANPQILYAHDDHGLPIGMGLKVRSGMSEGGRKALLLDEQYHGEDMLDDRGLLAVRLVLNGALPGRSVGFLPRKIEWPKDEDDAEKMGVRWPWGAYHREAELLESSVVPIPAYQHALQGKAMKAARAVINASDDLSPAAVREIEQSLTLTEQDAERKKREDRRSFVAFSKALGEALERRGAPAEEPEEEEERTVDVGEVADVAHARALTELLRGVDGLHKRLDEIEHRMEGREGLADHDSPHSSPSRREDPRGVYAALERAIDDRRVQRSTKR